MPKAKAQKQRPSAQEVALAQQAVWDQQRHTEAYLPLEMDAIKELDTADAGKRSAMLAGRANADLEQQARKVAEVGKQTDAKAETFGGGSTAMRGFRHAGALAQGRDALRVNADQKARDSIDQDRLNVIKTGRDVARQARSGLTASARLESSANASKLNAQAIKDQSRAAAIMQVGSAAAVKGFRTYDRAFSKVDNVNPDGTVNPNGGTYTYEAKELDDFENWVRGLRGPSSIHGPTFNPGV